MFRCHPASSVSLTLSHYLMGFRGKPQIAEIIRSFKGHVRKMLRHAEASAIVEYAYNDKAILEQRNMLTEELYGNTFQLYKVALQSIFSSVPAFPLSCYLLYLLMPCFQTVFLLWLVLQETILKDPFSFSHGLFCLLYSEQVIILSLSSGHYF